MDINQEARRDSWEIIRKSACKISSWQCPVCARQGSWCPQSCCLWGSEYETPSIVSRLGSLVVNHSGLHENFCHPWSWAFEPLVSSLWCYLGGFCTCGGSKSLWVGFKSLKFPFLVCFLFFIVCGLRCEPLASAPATMPAPCCHASQTWQTLVPLQP